MAATTPEYRKMALGFARFNRLYEELRASIKEFHLEDHSALQDAVETISDVAGDFEIAMDDLQAAK